MPEKSRKDTRVSITVHVRPDEAEHLDHAARLAGVSRHDLVRHRLFRQPTTERPLLACLGELIALRGQIERQPQDCASLHARIVAAVNEMVEIARIEISG